MVKALLWPGPTVVHEIPTEIKTRVTIRMPRTSPSSHTYFQKTTEKQMKDLVCSFFSEFEYTVLIVGCFGVHMCVT